MWHLWQQKNNIAVGRRVCTLVRVCVRVCVGLIRHPVCLNLFCQLWIAKSDTFKLKMSLFCVFFTLSLCFDPYHYRGMWKWGDAVASKNGGHLGVIVGWGGFHWNSEMHLSLRLGSGYDVSCEDADIIARTIVAISGYILNLADYV